MTTLLAHAGAGASWQALVAVIGVLTAGLFVLVVTRAVRIKESSDLVLPLAGVVIVSSLGTSASDTLSDQVGWAIPLGVVGLAALLVYGWRPDLMTLRHPTTWAVVAVAALSAFVFQGPLTRALHPPPILFDASSLPAVDDVTIAIRSPVPSENGSVEVTSPITLELEITGGTVGGELLSAADAPADPESLGLVRVLDGSTVLDVQPEQTCTPEDPCTILTYVLELGPGPHQLVVEFLTATGTTFRTSVFDFIRLDVP